MPSLTPHNIFPKEVWNSSMNLKEYDMLGSLRLRIPTTFLTFFKVGGGGAFLIQEITRRVREKVKYTSKSVVGGFSLLSQRLLTCVFTYYTLWSLLYVVMFIYSVVQVPVHCSVTPVTQDQYYSINTSQEMKYHTISCNTTQYNTIPYKAIWRNVPSSYSCHL